MYPELLGRRGIRLNFGFRVKKIQKSLLAFTVVNSFKAQKEINSKESQSIHMYQK